MIKIKFLLVALLISYAGMGQENNTLRFVLPSQSGWNQLEEGKTFSLQLQATGGTDSTYSFGISQGSFDGMNIDSQGNFSWTPSYELVERLAGEKIFQVIFNVHNQSGESRNQTVNFAISHRNRSPQVTDLKPFYVRYNASSNYQISSESVIDADKDPFVFIPLADQMPEGMKLTSRGEVSWSPSVSQFKQLREKPLMIPFLVEDQPAKSQVKGFLKVMITQMDLAPEINIIPKVSEINTKENQVVNLNFYLSDPNGDDDIAVFDFVSNNPAIQKQFLVKNTANQYEFQWKPGYDFVKDPLDSLNFQITFFVLDKAQQREEQTIRFTVFNTVNEAEKDSKQYELYVSTLTKGWELLEQLKEKEAELKKLYTKAKKGKKNRSIVTASFGATTGLSPVLTSNASRQRLISTIGGTSVVTISTLEATEVIGRSMKDLVERLNYVIEKKNEIQTKGDIFARDFALKSSRRSVEFNKKIDLYSDAMSLKGLVVLELDAGYTPKQKPTEDVLKKTFREFNTFE
jgi:hypothetical protein